VSVNIFFFFYKETAAKLNHLLASCLESAECLEKQRSIYEKYGVFTSSLIDGLINKLKSYNGRTLRKDIENDKEKVLYIVKKYSNIG
jgi:glutamine synthetase